MTPSPNTPNRDRLRLSAWHLACVLSAACGSGGESPGGNRASECEQEVDEYIARVSECLAITAEQRRTAIDQCTAGEFPSGAVPVQWRPEFHSHVDSCSDGLTCEQFLQDWDDICFPQALASLAPSLLSNETIDACINGDTDACKAQLQVQPETDSNVAGACFNRWTTCLPDLVNSDSLWTEDHCSMTLALTDAARSEAQSCIELTCSDVAECLRGLGALNF